MNTKKQFWTFRYALINIFYFASFCTIHAFAAVYLLDKGFTNTQIGILLAIANVLSALAQPFVAGLIDKPGKITNRNVIMALSLAMIFGAAILTVIDNVKIIVFIIFALIYMIQFVYQPVITALVFEYQKAGCNIFYGLARGLGSAGFAVTSVFMGNLVEKNGSDFLMYSSIVILSILVIMTFFFRKPECIEQVDAAQTNGDEKAHNNILEYARLYPSFMLFLVAVIFFFYSHNMLNDFLIQIIRSVNGQETQLGYATFLAAILELPSMALITILVKKISPEKMLIFSGIFFLIKNVIMFFATSMLLLYVSQACQMLAYAVFIPASAYYVNKIMTELDQVKGQAFITCAIVIGGVFSNLVSGVVLDRYGVKTMLIIGMVAAALGVLICIKSIIDGGKVRQNQN